MDVKTFKKHSNHIWKLDKDLKIIKNIMSSNKTDKPLQKSNYGTI